MSPSSPAPNDDAPGPKAPEPGRVVTVLAITACESDRRALGDVFRHTKWTLLYAAGLADALALLQENTIPVIICDTPLAEGHWTELLRQGAQTAGPPLIIVSSRLADDRLWAEVIAAGAFDVLEKPFNHSELVRVVSLAWLAWKDQIQRTNTPT